MEADKTNSGSRPHPSPGTPLTQRPPSGNPARVRPRPPTQPRDAPAPIPRAYERMRSGNVIPGLDSSSPPPSEIDTSPVASTGNGFRPASGSTTSGTPQYTAAELSVLPPRILTSKRISSADSVMSPSSQGISAPLTHSMTSSLSSRPLLRPASARMGPRSTPKHAAGTRIGFRHLWYCGDEDSICDVALRDTGLVQAALDRVHQVLDAKAALTPGAGALPPSAELSRLFFTDPSGDQQLVYRLGAVGKAGALERLSTVMAQVEAALLRLTDGLVDRRFTVPTIPDVGAGEVPESALPDPKASPETYSRAVMFTALAERVLALAAQLETHQQGPRPAEPRHLSEEEGDNVLAAAANKLAAAEESLRGIASDRQFNALAQPAALKALLQVEPSGQRTIAAWAAFVYDLSEHVREWVGKMWEYESEEHSHVVRELGDTVKQLRGEVFDLRTQPSRATDAPAGAENGANDVSVLRARIVEQADEIERLQALLAARVPPAEAPESGDNTNALLLRAECERVTRERDAAVKEVQQLQAALAAKDTPAAIRAAAAQRQAQQQTAAMAARAREAEDKCQELEGLVASLQTRLESSEGEYARVLLDKQALQTQLFEQSAICDADISNACSQIEKAVETFTRATGAAPSTASEDNVSMLLCVTMGKLDKLRQATGAIDSISRELALRRESELSAAQEEARALQRERDATQASLDSERAAFVRDVMGLREEVARLSERVAKLRGTSGKGPYGSGRAGTSLVDDPADDCALLLDGAYRREMEALRRAFQREISRLKEANHRSECESARSLRNTQTALTELQRIHAQTMSKLKAALNDKK